MSYVKYEVKQANDQPLTANTLQLKYLLTSVKCIICDITYGICHEDLRTIYLVYIHTYMANW